MHPSWLDDDEGTRALVHKSMKAKIEEMSVVVVGKLLENDAEASFSVLKGIAELFDVAELSNVDELVSKLDSNMLMCILSWAHIGVSHAFLRAVESAMLEESAL